MKIDRTDQDYRRGFQYAAGCCSGIIEYIVPPLIIVIVVTIILSYSGCGMDDTDLSAMRRSDVQLITDHGTGRQYLYKDGALIPRLPKQVDRFTQHWQSVFNGETGAVYITRGPEE